MKTEALANRSWDDMVFENRHKEYGAYSIRQAYSRNVTIGFAITATAAILIIVLPRLLPSVKIENALPNSKSDGKTVLVEPTIIRIEKPKITTVATAQRTDQLAIRVTHAEVTEPTPTVAEQSQIVTSTSTEGGDGVVEFSDGGGEVGVPEAPAEPVVTNKVYEIVQEMPSYEGGLSAMAKFISRNTKYPAPARRIGLEGTVFVSFVINYAGKVTDVKVVKGISAECDNEAARVIASMPPWKAGIQNGIPVSVRMIMPIKFALNH